MIDILILLRAAHDDRFGGPQVFTYKKGERAAHFRLYKAGMLGRGLGMPVGHFYVTDNGHEVAAQLSATLYPLAEGLSK